MNEVQLSNLQSTFYHSVPRSFKYSFDQPQEDEVALGATQWF